MAYRHTDTHTYHTQPILPGSPNQTMEYAHCAIYYYYYYYEYSQIQGPAATLLNCNAISGGITMDTLHSKVIIALTWLITTHTKLNLDIFFCILIHIWHIYASTGV